MSQHVVLLRVYKCASEQSWGCISPGCHPQGSLGQCGLEIPRAFLSYGTSWSREKFQELQHTESQLSPLGQRLSSLTSVFLKSYCSDVHLGNRFPCSHLPIRIQRNKWDTFELLLSSHSKQGYKRQLMSVWGIREKEALNKDMGKEADGFWGSSCPSAQAGLEFPKFSPLEAACMILPYPHTTYTNIELFSLNRLSPKHSICKIVWYSIFFLLHGKTSIYLKIKNPCTSPTTTEWSHSGTITGTHTSFWLIPQWANSSRGKWRIYYCLNWKPKGS